MTTRMSETLAYKGPVVNPMGTFNSLSAYQTAIDTAMKQDRAHEINMRTLEYEAGKQALGLSSSAQSGKANELADKFLSTWDQYMTDAKGIYNQALKGYDQGFEYLRDAKAGLGKLDDISADIDADLGTFREQFGPLQSDLAAGAQTNLRNQQEMGAQLKDLAKADYEGVAGRAMADVSQQAELARQAEARRLQQVGQDPASMRSRSINANLATGEATGKALAANMARRGEKERVTGITGEAFQLFDPTKLAQTALNIRSGQNELQSLRADLAQTGVNARGDIARTAGNMASSMGQTGSGLARDIGAQYGDMAGLFSGLNYAANQSVPAYDPTNRRTIGTGIFPSSVVGGGNPTARVDAISAQNSLQTVQPMPAPMPAYMNMSLPGGSYYNM